MFRYLAENRATQARNGTQPGHGMGHVGSQNQRYTANHLHTLAKSSESASKGHFREASVCEENEKGDGSIETGCLTCEVLALSHPVLLFATRSQIDGRPGVPGKCRIEIIARDLRPPRACLTFTMKNDWPFTILTVACLLRLLCKKVLFTKR